MTFDITCYSMVLLSHFEFLSFQTNVIMMFVILQCFRGVRINLDSLKFIQKGHRGQKGSMHVRVAKVVAHHKKLLTVKLYVNVYFFFDSNNSKLLMVLNSLQKKGVIKNY